MPHPPVQRDPVEAEIEAIVAVIADGSITDDQHRRLEELLTRHPHAIGFYYECLMVHTALEMELRGTASKPTQALGVLASIATVPGKTPVTNEAEARRRGLIAGSVSWRRIAALVTLGVGLLIALSMLIKTPPPPPPIATLTEQSDARWVDHYGRLIFRHPGDRLAPGSVHLSQGMARIRFDDGAVVLLDARTDDVHFETRTANEGFLHRGRLTARAQSPQAAGFTVALPGDVRVVDVSTEFGIVVQPDGSSLVQVIEGEVRADRVQSDGTIIQGDTLRSDAAYQFDKAGPKPRALAKADDFTRIADFDRSRQLAAQSSNHNKTAAGQGVQGAARLISDPASLRNVGDVISDAHLTVISEGRAVTLDAPLKVALVDPRSLRINGDKLLGLAQQMPAGRKVVPHLVIVAPDMVPGENGKSVAYRGSIRFDRPVAGILVQLAGCKAVAPKAFGIALAQWPGSNAPVGVGTNDDFTLSPDGRTIELAFQVERGWCNYLCILVDADDHP